MNRGTPARTLILIASLFSLNLFASEAPHNESLLQVDHSFVTSLEKADKTQVEPLLNEHFTWTDSNGKTTGRAEFLANLRSALNSPAAASEPRLYGSVALITGAVGKTQVLRVWVREKSSWSVLAIHETTLVEKSTPPKNDSVNCENPCRTLPYTPRNEDEKEIIASWQALESAVTAHDAQTWADHVADEFEIINNNNDHVYTKRDRMAILDKQKQQNSPSAPVPLVSAEMYDYPSAVVMKAEHRRSTGKGIHVTRIWIKRDGKWVMAFSQQTTEQ